MTQPKIHFSAEELEDDSHFSMSSCQLPLGLINKGDRAVLQSIHTKVSIAPAAVDMQKRQLEEGGAPLGLV